MGPTAPPSLAKSTLKLPSRFADLAGTAAFALKAAGFDLLPASVVFFLPACAIAPPVSPQFYLDKYCTLC